MNFKSLSVLCLVILSSKLFAQNPCTIKGRIIDKITKEPLTSASVQLTGEKGGVTTDTSGVFVLSNLNEDVYSLTINYLGYQEEVIHDIRVIRNKVTYLEVELEMVSKSLSAVSVIAKSFKYENSPLNPVSTYSFSREEISRNPGAQGDILRAIGMLPGVSSSGGAFSAIAVRGQGTRDNTYFVDDIPVFSLAHLEGSPSGFNDPNGGKPTYNYIIRSNIFNDPSNLRYSQEITSFGTRRLPYFMSIDARADYNFKIKSIALDAFIDIADINNRTNAFQESFNPLTGKTFYDGIAVFPSFGLKFQF